MYNDAKTIVDQFSRTPQKKSFCQLVEEEDKLIYEKLLFDKRLSTHTNAKFFLVNSVVGSKREMSAGRVARLKGYLIGEMDHMKSDDLTKKKVSEFINDARSFQLVGFYETKADQEVNPFLKTLQLASGVKRDLSLCVHSLSTQFYHNGNVECEILAALHFGGYLDLDVLGNTLQARNKPGRPGNDKGWAYELGRLQSTEERVASIYKSLMQKPMQYFGFSVLRQWGDSLHQGVVRSCRFKRNKKGGILAGSWDVHYPFYDGSDYGDQEMLDANQVAEGIVRAYELGHGGPFILHANTRDGRQARAAVSSNSTPEGKSNSSSLSWTPHCDCVPQLPAVRCITRRSNNANNLRRAFYKCGKTVSQGQCKYYRWEDTLKNFN
ncbi:MAG: hypothetical protein ACREBR_00100 [bacterium]